MATKDEVRQAYKDYLGRDPKPGEYELWRDYSKDDLDRNVRGSPEYQLLVKKYRPTGLSEDYDFEVYFGTDSDWHGSSRNTLIYAPNVQLAGDEYESVADKIFFDKGQPGRGVLGWTADLTGISEIYDVPMRVIPNEAWAAAEIGLMFLPGGWAFAGRTSAITGGTEARENAANTFDEWFGINDALDWMKFGVDTGIRTAGMMAAGPTFGLSMVAAEGLIFSLNALEQKALNQDPDWQKMARDFAVNAGIGLATAGTTSWLSSGGAAANQFVTAGASAFGITPYQFARVMGSLIQAGGGVAQGYYSTKDWRKALIQGAVQGGMYYGMSSANDMSGYSKTRVSPDSTTSVSPEQAGVTPAQAAQGQFNANDPRTWKNPDGTIRQEALDYVMKHPEEVHAMSRIESMHAASTPAVRETTLQKVLGSGQFWGSAIMALGTVATTKMMLDANEKAAEDAQRDYEELIGMLGGGGGGGGGSGGAGAQYYRVYEGRGAL